jgi:hypothetical protein
VPGVRRIARPVLFRVVLQLPERVHPERGNHPLRCRAVFSKRIAFGALGIPANGLWNIFVIPIVHVITDNVKPQEEKN